MATENIVIKIREDGSRVVSRNVKEIGDAAGGASTQLISLKGILASIAASGLIAAVGSLADEYTNLQNKLRLVTTGTSNLARVTDELLGIANSTRSSFSATAEMYSRMANASKTLGLGQQQLLDFTKSVNQAIVLSGASASEAAGGLRQLSQGMAAGTLRGDELNSVLENLPVVADVIAKGMGVTRGELRALGADGKVTARDIVDAFAMAQQELDQGFATTIPTMGQAFTVLQNNFLTFIGELDKSTGVTAGISRAILAIADNLNTLIPILAGIGVAIAATFVPGVITAFTTAIKGLWLAIVANPIGAVAVAIAGVTTALFLMRDEIKLGIDDTTTLGDMMDVVWADIKTAAGDAWDVVSGFFDSMRTESGEASEDVIADAKKTGQENEATWLKAVRFVAQAIDMIAATIRGFFSGVWSMLKKTADLWMQTFSNMGDAAQAVMSGDLAGAQAALDAQKELVANAGADIGSAFSDAFAEEALRQDSQGFEAMLDDWIVRAQEAGKARLAAGAEGGLDGGGPPTPPGATDDGKAAKEAQKLADSLNNLLNTINPVRAAQQELAAAEALLARGVAAGLITRDQATEALEQYKDMMFEALDPYGALQKAVSEEIRLAGLLGDEREIEIQLMQQVEQLKRSGVIATEDMTAAMREELVLLQQINRESQIKEELLRNSAGEQEKEWAAQLAALEQLKANPSWTDGDAFAAANNLLGGLLDSTTEAVLQQTEMYEQMYARIEELRQLDLISEQTASEAKMALKRMEMDAMLSRTSDALGAAAGLMKSNSKTAFETGKAAAIGQAIVNTYSSAVAAYQSAANIPYVGWILGPAAAAGAIAAGMAQVSAIRSQQMPAFKTGGEYTVGGAGGPDSQTVAFRATPGERISINTPSQARALEQMGERAERPSRNFTQNVTIVQQGRPDRKTPEQQARALRKQAQREVQFEE